ncbi:abasic site processing protein HMCES isoform X6 [Bacillus rossius redtenbacheri]|uniref:abasic site processing protein HMCES isoform X6 n=1 Tax=Bacillus rossius redtenbacheri TaxID=93214 RepID=UPI002FDDF8E2
MCGRTACTLCAEDVRKACCYRSEAGGVYRLPDWREADDPRLSYKPSHNVAPTDATPVLVSGRHFPGAGERVLQTMLWGMIPPWHKGDPKSHGLSTNNCRLEGARGSKLYGRALGRGQRCCVVLDGFYEWQAGTKQPYFVYCAAQPDGVLIDDPSTWDCRWSPEGGWCGPQLLRLAALFDVWTSPQGTAVHSYSLITMEADKSLGWLHHRMPAVLSSEQQVAAWLDCAGVKGDAALALLGAPGPLAWHPVSSLVNNARHKDAACNRRVDLARA